MDMSELFKQDQDDEAVRRLARMFGAYYLNLVEAGIPVELAQVMVEDYHWTTFCCASYRESGNYPPRS